MQKLLGSIITFVSVVLDASPSVKIVTELQLTIELCDGRKPAWGYASLEEPCFGQTVVAAIIYGFVGTD